MKQLKYFSGETKQWHFDVPERLPEGEAVRVLDKALKPQERPVLYHSKEGNYVIAPDILIPYMIAFGKQNPGVTEKGFGPYGTAYIEAKYDKAIERFNLISNRNFTTKKIESAKEKAEVVAIEKATKQNIKAFKKVEKIEISSEPKKRGRKSKEGMDLTKANNILYRRRKEDKNITEDIFLAAVDFFKSIGKTKPLEKHFPTYL